MGDVRVGVIGGGIAGLTVATVLEQLGFAVSVFEAAPTSSARGALLLWANATRALASIGRPLGPEVGAPIETTEVRAANGTVLSSLPIGEWSRATEGASVVVRRPDLLAHLEAGLGPATVQRGRRLASFRAADDRVELAFEDRAVESVDVVIAADGIGSTVRAQLLGGAPPRHTGQEAWVGVSPARPREVRDGVTVAAVGRGPRFWFAPLADGATFWFATRATAAADGDDPRVELERVYRDWHAPIPELVTTTPIDEIVHTRIRDCAPAERWGQGRITLLGDAIHPTTPDLGQGACQAIESAVMLGACLRDQREVEPALRDYERRRMKRTATISRLSWMTATNSTVRDPLLCQLRDGAIRAALRPVARYHLDWILRG